jgi:hypothetical protein
MPWTREGSQKAALRRIPCPECGRDLRPSALTTHVTAAHTRAGLLPGQMTPAELERFLIRIEIAVTGCWLWTGGLDESGYGLCSVGYPGRTRRAHLVSYEHVIGPIPAGLTLDHLCRTPGCVNPTHTEPVSLVTNVMRGQGRGVLNAAKTHCAKGHPFDDENTGYSTISRKRGGERVHQFCRACAQVAKRNYQLRKRAVA